MPCVLLVDDDSAVRVILKLFLQEGGYAVLEAQNGREAIALLDSADLLLTDIVMPDKEGVELIRVARRSRAGLPIVAMSGASFGDSYLEIVSRLGADYTLRKPISCNQLLATIQQALGPPAT